MRRHSPFRLALCASTLLAAAATALPRVTADLSSNPTDSGSYTQGFVNVDWNGVFSSRASASFSPSSSNELNGDAGELYANRTSQLVLDLDAFCMEPEGWPTAFFAGASWYSNRADEKANYLETGATLGLGSDAMVLSDNALSMDTLGPRIGARYSASKLFGLPLGLQASLAVIPVYVYFYGQDLSYDFLAPGSGAGAAAPVLAPLSVQIKRLRIGSPIVQASTNLNAFSWFSLGLDYVFQNIPFDYLQLEADYSGASPVEATYNLHDLSASAFLQFEAIKGASLKLGVEWKNSWTVNPALATDGDPLTNPLLEHTAPWRLLFGFTLG